MSRPSLELHKVWMEQCAATENIRQRFGLENALDYLIGEKLFSFVTASEQHPDFAAELLAFVAKIKRLFTSTEIQEYLDYLERTKFLAPPKPDPGTGDDQADEDPWLENPILGAEELLRFPPIRQLLQP